MTSVVDASALLDSLLGVVPAGNLPLLSGDLAAPDLVYPEVANAIARLRRRGLLDADDADLLMEGLRDAPLHVEPTRDLVPRALALSANLSVYDGCYVALAESLGCRLITADRRIAGAPGLPVEVVLV